MCLQLAYLDHAIRCFNGLLQGVAVETPLVESAELTRRFGAPVCRITSYNVCYTKLLRAPVERVFALMANPAMRARLNPDETPLTVEIENGAPLRRGSICHYRLQHGRRIRNNFV